MVSFNPNAIILVWLSLIPKQFFKVQYGDMVIAFNPVSKQSKLSAKAPHFGSAIALSTTNHADYNGFEAVEYAGTVPFAISGPGDYEVKDIFIKGATSEAENRWQKIYKHY